MSGIRSASVALIDEQDRLMKYIPPEVKRRIAQNANNFDAQREIIHEFIEMNHPSLLRVFSGQYDSEVRSFVGSIETEFPDIVDGQREKQLKIKVPTPPKPSVFPEKTITQRQRSGTMFKRSTPKRFSKKEVEFIKSRSDMNTKDLVAEFNTKFTARSNSSISTKKSRVKKLSKNEQ
jgi:hypothetical protein|tara:strand:- start:21335 stop:21865 length:531 start_codon:yes stop_codon:yes gene_type:complete